MRKIRDISEDEMVAVNLQTKLNSVRFRWDIEAYVQQERIDPHMLHVPDWRNAQEKVHRRAILGLLLMLKLLEEPLSSLQKGVR